MKKFLYPILLLFFIFACNSKKEERRQIKIKPTSQTISEKRNASGKQWTIVSYTNEGGTCKYYQLPKDKSSQQKEKDILYYYKRLPPEYLVSNQEATNINRSKVIHDGFYDKKITHQNIKNGYLRAKLDGNDAEVEIALFKDVNNFYDIVLISRPFLINETLVALRLTRGNVWEDITTHLFPYIFGECAPPGGCVSPPFNLPEYGTTLEIHSRGDSNKVKVYWVNGHFRSNSQIDDLEQVQNTLAEKIAHKPSKTIEDYYLAAPNYFFVTNHIRNVININTIRDKVSSLHRQKAITKKNLPNGFITANTQLMFEKDFKNNQPNISFYNREIDFALFTTTKGKNYIATTINHKRLRFYELSSKGIWKLASPDFNKKNFYTNLDKVRKQHGNNFLIKLPEQGTDITIRHADSGQILADFAWRDGVFESK